MDLSILSIYNPWWDLSKNTGEIKDKLVNYSALTDRASGRELSPIQKTHKGIPASARDS